MTTPDQSYQPDVTLSDAGLRRLRLGLDKDPTWLDNDQLAERLARLNQLYQSREITMTEYAYYTKQVLKEMKTRVKYGKSSQQERQQVRLREFKDQLEEVTNQNYQKLRYELNAGVDIPTDQVETHTAQQRKVENLQLEIARVEAKANTMQDEINTQITNIDTLIEQIDNLLQQALRIETERVAIADEAKNLTGNLGKE